MRLAPNQQRRQPSLRAQQSARITLLVILGLSLVATFASGMCYYTKDDAKDSSCIFPKLLGQGLEPLSNALSYVFFTSSIILAVSCCARRCMSNTESPPVPRSADTQLLTVSRLSFIVGIATLTTMIGLAGMYKLAVDTATPTNREKTFLMFEIVVTAILLKRHSDSLIEGVRSAFARTADS